MSGQVKSIAARAAEIMGGNGLAFTAPDGRRLAAVCDGLGGRHEAHRATESDRWTFPDGSRLVACGEGWDLGYDEAESDCYCWREVGHTDDCLAGQRATEDGAPCIICGAVLPDHDEGCRALGPWT